MSTVKKGKEAEKLAAHFLETKGYHILEYNYRHKKGEIDLVAKEDTTLVFVEVKMKTSARYGYPEDAVNQKKRELILATADHYIHETDWKGLIRFDIIAILNDPLNPSFEHFEDAFY